MNESDENLIHLDEVRAKGHPNILSTHRSTFEITTEDFLTINGNCIIGILGTKSVSNLNLQLKKAIQSGMKIFCKIIAGEHSDTFFGYGNPDLTLSNLTSMVFRKSEFVSDRTILIRCSKGAKDLNRELINFLKDECNECILQFFIKKENV